MTPANDPAVDYRALVRRGYDTCAQAYDSSRRTEPGTELEALSSRLQVTTTGHGYEEGTQPPELHPLVLARKE